MEKREKDEERWFGSDGKEGFTQRKKVNAGAPGLEAT